MKGLGGVVTPLFAEDAAEAGLPMNIQGCPNGCVCLSFGAAAIHLQPEEFIRFMGLAAEALSRMTVRKPTDASEPEGLLIQ